MKKEEKITKEIAIELALWLLKKLNTKPAVHIKNIHRTEDGELVEVKISFDDLVFAIMEKVKMKKIDHEIT